MRPRVADDTAMTLTHWAPVGLVPLPQGPQLVTREKKRRENEDLGTAVIFGGMPWDPYMFLDDNASE